MHAACQRTLALTRCCRASDGRAGNCSPPCDDSRSARSRGTSAHRLNLNDFMQLYLEFAATIERLGYREASVSDSSAIMAMPGITGARRRLGLRFSRRSAMIGLRGTRRARPIRWTARQQIRSNAGACAMPVVIAQGGSSLVVTANNGSATSLRTATPIGQPGRPLEWKLGGASRQAVSCRFVLKDQRLVMSMLVEMENGSRRQILGVFGRVWFGA